MATGTYGIVRPADITPEDVEIFYHFTPSRDSIGSTGLIKLDPPSQYLMKTVNPNGGGIEIFGGL